MILVGSSQNLVLKFAFGCPTGLPNFCPIKVCISELEQFLCLHKKKNRKKKEKKTLVFHISGMISLNLECSLPLEADTSTANMVFFR